MHTTHRRRIAWGRKPTERADVAKHYLASPDVLAEANGMVASKGARHISVVLPAHNEQATVAEVVRRIRVALCEACPLVDEVVVMSDRSTDHTVERASAAGATVFSTNDVLSEHGPSRGKGDAIWRSLEVTVGDILVFCDADLEDFDPAIVTRLVFPLLADPTVSLVKGYFRREGADGKTAGGRVTELSARPLLEALAPHLAHIREPLGGMFATTRRVLERIPIESDYGVDLGILADIAALPGAGSITQVDLGVLVHRHRELHELTETARQVVRSILDRFGSEVVASHFAPTRSGMRRPPHRSTSRFSVSRSA